VTRRWHELPSISTDPTSCKQRRPWRQRRRINKATDRLCMALNYGRG
jgi:hypothetical protein